MIPLNQDVLQELTDRRGISLRCEMSKELLATALEANLGHIEFIEKVKLELGNQNRCASSSNVKKFFEGNRNRFFITIYENGVEIGKTKQLHLVPPEPWLDAMNNYGDIMRYLAWFINRRKEIRTIKESTQYAIQHCLEKPSPEGMLLQDLEDILQESLHPDIHFRYYHRRNATHRVDLSYINLEEERGVYVMLFLGKHRMVGVPDPRYIKSKNDTAAIRQYMEDCTTAIENYIERHC